MNTCNNCFKGLSHEDWELTTDHGYLDKSSSHTVVKMKSEQGGLERIWGKELERVWTAFGSCFPREGKGEMEQ